MLRQFESKWYDVELLRALSKELYFQSVSNPCRISRGRAGWELLKTNQAKKQRQKELVRLADQAMTSDALYQVLQSQNIQIY